jgi:hypothetical protein
LSDRFPSDADHSLPDSPVLGWLGPRDFVRARLNWPRFRVWRDHREFIAERDGLRLGYLCSGVTATFQRVTVDAFERWVRLTGAPCDLDGLDAFAAQWRWRTRHPTAPVVGRFGVADDPERAPAAEGWQRVLVRPEIFVRWRDDFARAKLFAAPDIDAYAAHVVECCLPCGKRLRRSAVSSA